MRCYKGTMNTASVFTLLPDDALIAEVKVLAERERRSTADLIACLAEVDARKLYRGEGCSSLYVYCTRVLHLSEHAAYGRIEAARAVRRFPGIVELLVTGAMNLTTVCLLARHLTAENHAELLRAAMHKSKREVEHLVAALRPRPDVAASIRKLPRPKPVEQQTADEVRTAPPLEEPATAMSAPARPPVIAPLAPARYKVQFTVSCETYEKLRRAQNLLRHSVPNGDPGVIFDRALTLLLAEAERRKIGATTRPNTRSRRPSPSRYIPVRVKREVWSRDGGQCAFVGAEGRCTERGLLEFHHVEPYAAGGATTAANLELRCRAHNAYEAERYFGPRQPSLVREEAPQFGAAGPGKARARIICPTRDTASPIPSMP